jgi:hypothetical protein
MDRPPLDILWKPSAIKTFRFEDAAKLLMEKNKDAWEQVPVFLSRYARQAFCLLNPMHEMHGKKLYRLHSRKQKSLKNLAEEISTPYSSGQPTLIRTRVDYNFIHHSALHETRQRQMGAKNTKQPTKKPWPTA